MPDGGAKSLKEYIKQIVDKSRKTEKDNKNRK